MVGGLSCLGSDKCQRRGASRQVREHLAVASPVTELALQPCNLAHTTHDSSTHTLTTLSPDLAKALPDTTPLSDPRGLTNTTPALHNQHITTHHVDCGEKTPDARLQAHAD